MEIFVVGGAVRDELLGLTPKDIDYIVVGATPADMIKQGFEQVGADFPVFLHPVTKDEYALARIERKVGDGYHGFAVDFDTSVTLEDDLFRRDLTINAMAKKADGTIVDPYNGQRDLREKILRHVSPAFAEDPLRVVRLARFYTRHNGFSVAKETLDMAFSVVESGDLNHLPHERFWAELQKVFTEEKRASFFTLMHFLGMDKHTDFFGGLYGKINVSKLVQITRIDRAVSKVEDAEERMMYHTAITADADSSVIKTGTVRLQKLFKNVQNIRLLPQNVHEVFEVFHAAKAWSQGPDVEDLINAMRFMVEAGEKFWIGPDMMQDALAETKKVMAEQYVNTYTGKALGEAIKNGRKAAIKKVIGE